MRRWVFKTKKKHDKSTMLNTIPMPELSYIVNDANNHQLTDLHLSVKDLRLKMVPATGYLFQLFEDEKPDMLFDADFDFNIIRRTKQRTVTADVAVAMKTADEEERALVLNIQCCAVATTPGYIVNHQVDELLADYGLYYLSGVIKRLDLTKYRVTSPVIIPRHLSDLQQQDSYIYDGFKVKYQLFV